MSRRNEVDARGHDGARKCDPLVLKLARQVKFGQMMARPVPETAPLFEKPHSRDRQHASQDPVVTPRPADPCPLPDHEHADVRIPPQVGKDPQVLEG
jgi:hypothetical protein